MVFVFSRKLKKHNSITVVPIDLKLGIYLYIRDSATNNIVTLTLLLLEFQHIGHSDTYVNIHLVQMKSTYDKIGLITNEVNAFTTWVPVPVY